MLKRSCCTTVTKRHKWRNLYIDFMENKANFVYVLMILWIIVAVLFICKDAYLIGSYFESLEHTASYSYESNKFDNYHMFVLTTHIGYAVSLMVVSILLSLGVFWAKKLTWLVGLMFSGYILILSINSIISNYGMTILLGSLTYNGENLMYVISILIAPPCLLALSIILIYYLTRPFVKEYFGITQQFPHRNY